MSKDDLRELKDYLGRCSEVNEKEMLERETNDDPRAGYDVIGAILDQSSGQGYLRVDTAKAWTRVQSRIDRSDRI